MIFSIWDESESPFDIIQELTFIEGVDPTELIAKGQIKSYAKMIKTFEANSWEEAREYYDDFLDNLPPYEFRDISDDSDDDI